MVKKSKGCEKEHPHANLQICTYSEGGAGDGRVHSAAVLAGYSVGAKPGEVIVSNRMVP